LILSEVTGALPPPPEPIGDEATADAGNSFSEASYEGRRPRVRFTQGFPPGGHGGPCNMSKVKTSDQWMINEASTDMNPSEMAEGSVAACEKEKTSLRFEKWGGCIRYYNAPELLM